MRVLMIFFACIGLALAAPQGYNYQIEVGATGGNNVQAIPNQYQQGFQQYSPQIQIQTQQPQQQPQTVQQEQFVGQIPQFNPQAFSLDQGGHQFGNQLLQNAQQVIQFEQQQLPAVQQQFHAPAPVVEPPQQPENLASVKQFDVVPTPAVAENQPHFIIKSMPKSGNHFQSAASAPKKVTFQKEFFYLSAPPEEDESPKELDDELSTLKKNLRVVFIKAPENNGLEKAALQLAKQSANSQTAIYVLTKQHDASELANKLQSIQSTAQRPEVAFIKYRTPEEAEHAQRVIQAQYESLDGPNHINRPDTGITHNFVGATGSGDPRKSSVGVDEKVEISKPVSKYLPASAKH